MINAAIVILLVYISVAITFLVIFVFKKINTKKATTKNKVVVTADDLFERDFGTQEKQSKNNSRVIPLTDEYEYEQSKKFKDLSDR